MSVRSRSYTVAIIGLGPRGLCVLGELMRVAPSLSKRGISLKLLLIEPRDIGPGVHETSLENHFKLNTTAGILTALNPRVDKDNQTSSRLTFLEWLRRSSPCAPEAYSSRASFGQYLSHCHKCLVENCPSNVSLTTIHHSAIDIQRSTSGNVVTLENELQICCDFLFLTCGRLQLREIDGRQANGRIGASALYRQPFCGIPPLLGVKVAINGMGLTAYDALSALTIGRGGSFVDDTSSPKKYVPSDIDCVIYLFSRSGIPFRSRCPYPKDRTHVPIIFTRERIQRLREEQGLLDFQNHIEPMLYTEIRLAYYVTHIALHLGESARQRETRKFAKLYASGRSNSWFDTMQKQYGPFDEKEALWPTIDSTGPRAYLDNWLAILSDDLRESRLGYSRSPLKAAIEVLLELRPEIKLAVDNGRLTESSKRDFYQRFVTLINRNVIGPQIERNEELLSLVQSGIVSLASGPSPIIEPGLNGAGFLISPTTFSAGQITVDYVIDAFVEDSTELFERSVLLRNLHGSGMASFSTLKRDGVSGLRTDPTSGLLDASGVRNPTIWALGSLCEGTTYYNNYAPTVFDDASAPAFTETSLAIRQMCESI